ncbi:MAG: hypothetical protein ABSB11_04855 [Sedimentisphaerales bacterium]|jgi:hypothetical protein
MGISEEWMPVVVLFWLLASVAIIVLAVVLLVILTRWIFRINEIVDLLKQIAKTDEKDAVIRRQSDLNHCSACWKEYPAGKLVKIDSGQLLCHPCYKMYENKKGKKI